jgi:hypothetical protein
MIGVKSMAASDPSGFYLDTEYDNEQRRLYEEKWGKGADELTRLEHDRGNGAVAKAGYDAKAKVILAKGEAEAKKILAAAEAEIRAAAILKEGVARNKVEADRRRRLLEEAADAWLFDAPTPTEQAAALPAPQPRRIIPAIFRRFGRRPAPAQQVTAGPKLLTHQPTPVFEIDAMAVEVRREDDRGDEW